MFLLNSICAILYLTSTLVMTSYISAGVTQYKGLLSSLIALQASRKQTLYGITMTQLCRMIKGRLFSWSFKELGDPKHMYPQLPKLTALSLSVSWAGAAQLTAWKTLSLRRHEGYKMINVNATVKFAWSHSPGTKDTMEAHALDLIPLPLSLNHQVSDNLNCALVVQHHSSYDVLL